MDSITTLELNYNTRLEAIAARIYSAWLAKYTPSTITSTTIKICADKSMTAAKVLLDLIQKEPS
jgi:predicted RNA polymerase sigma factor